MAFTKVQFVKRYFGVRQKKKTATSIRSTILKGQEVLKARKSLFLDEKLRNFFKGNKLQGRRAHREVGGRAHIEVYFK